MTDITSIITSFSYTAIVLLMTTNGVISFPSSQLLYLVTGYLVSKGTLSFSLTVLLGALGNALGNMIMFYLVKKYDKPFAQKILLLDKDTFTKIHTIVHAMFSKKGIWWLFIAKCTPSLKVLVPIVAALANTPSKITAFIFFSSSLLWASIFVSLGYFFGTQLSLHAIAPVSFILGLIVIGALYISFQKQNLK